MVVEVKVFYELGVLYPCPDPRSKCVFLRLISFDLSRVDWSGIVPILFVLTRKELRHYQLAMSKNIVITLFLTYIICSDGSVENGIREHETPAMTDSTCGERWLFMRRNNSSACPKSVVLQYLT